MPRATCPLTLGAVALFGLFAPLASAQEKRDADRDRGDGVFRMTILNGSTTTVRYFSDRLSDSDRAILRDVEVLENEASLARELLELKHQYVLSERLLEPHRRTMQRLLYGTDVTTTDYAFTGGYWPGVTGASVWGNYAWTGTAWGGGAGGAVTVHHGLGTGVGDEGRMKDALARVVALQTSPEYLSAAQQGRGRVMARAAASPALRGVFGEARGDGIRPAAGEVDRDGVTLTLKSGEKLRGTRIEEAGDWITLHTEAGRRTRVRQAEVVRIDQPAK